MLKILFLTLIIFRKDPFSLIQTLPNLRITLDKPLRKSDCTRVAINKVIINNQEGLASCKCQWLWSAPAIPSPATAPSVNGCCCDSHCSPRPTTGQVLSLWAPLASSHFFPVGRRFAHSPLHCHHHLPLSLVHFVTPLSAVAHFSPSAANICWWRGEQSN